MVPRLLSLPTESQERSRRLVVLLQSQAMVVGSKSWASRHRLRPSAELGS